MINQENLLTVKEAGIWASNHTGKNVTPSNIAYLINYGRILKTEINGTTLIPKQELIDYYESFRREAVYKKKLGEDLNWVLSFDQHKESETTKHVHRLHPYKGKFYENI